MIVDTANPEVSEALARWFQKRDELYERRSQDEISPRDQETITDIMGELVDIADELVAFLAPTARDREHHLSLNPDPHADNPAA
ncbi:hypothetical protein [Mycobacteroides abscessus]|uniref:hypothetical protein n=1 Tax=Mycobacteroides abscessus TaxID=36809 RepID=UPI00031E0B98|nr:hypothetical protein [Mycobacteroides abscessus]